MSCSDEEIMHFEREEVSFEHEACDFIYIFHRFESGNITFKRKWPTSPTQEPEVVIYPCGQQTVASTAIIVLFKCVTSGTERSGLTGFLPDMLKAILDLHWSKETLIAHLSKAIDSFPVAVQKIASIEDVMQFIAPSASWTVQSPLHLHVNED